MHVYMCLDRMYPFPSFQFLSALLHVAMQLHLFFFSYMNFDYFISTAMVYRMCGLDMYKRWCLKKSEDSLCLRAVCSKVDRITTTRHCVIHLAQDQNYDDVGVSPEASMPPWLPIYFSKDIFAFILEQLLKLTKYFSSFYLLSIYSLPLNLIKSTSPV